MNESQLKGKIFEKIIEIYLEQQGYEVIPKEIKNYYGVCEEPHGLTVKGRGGRHQIDTLGQFQFHIPFVYPLRLLCEAKCHVKKIGLPTVRNFVGVLKDVSENYFIDDYEDLEYKDRFRFTDCGAIFSTSEFTKEAQMYAYAQGIYLIQPRELLLLVEDIVREIRHSSQNFNEFIKRFINEGDTFCYFGIALGIYPLAIVSRRKLPLEKFREK